jgi:hypothetical protein
MIRIIVVKNLDFLDFSYDAISLTEFSVLEPTLGIVNACFPVMKPAFKKLFPSKHACQGSNTAQNQWYEASSKPSNIAQGIRRRQETLDLEYTLNDLAPEGGVERGESMHSREGFVVVGSDVKENTHVFV